MNYPHIDQLRHVVQEMEKRGIQQAPFRGTTKIHGTNARIIVSEDSSREYGSKNQVVASGHYGFVEWAQSHTGVVASVPAPYIIYGEWAGVGIQSGVPYPKSFFVFSVYSQGKWYTDEVVNTGREDGAYLISEFGVHSVLLVLETIEQQSTDLFSMVDAIETECPVAKALGFPGSTGEGIVFVSSDTNDPSRGFKVKGDKHATTRVVKTAKPTISGLREFLEATVTEVRLNQGLEYFDAVPENTSSFIKWIVGDIDREDSDLIPDGSSKKEFIGPIGPMAAKWFIAKCRE
jgi:hypothetical protein